MEDAIHWHFGWNEGAKPTIHSARRLAIVEREQLAVEAADQGALNIFNAALNVSEAETVPAFLHSALCAMSLPARRPKDEMAPIIRQDGRYTLAIMPKPTLIRRGGEVAMQSLGVPFGSYPRIILIYIMSEAVRTSCRDVYLGGSFCRLAAAPGLRQRHAWQPGHCQPPETSARSPACLRMDDPLG